MGNFGMGVRSQYFQTNPNPNHIQKYPFIYLISQKVDPFINSPTPKVNFIKSLIAKLTFYWGVQKLDDSIIKHWFQILERFH